MAIKHSTKIREGLYYKKYDSISEQVAHVTDEKNIAPVNLKLWKKNRDHFADSFRNQYNVKRSVRELEEPPKASKEVRGLATQLEEQFDFEQTMRKRTYRREQGDELDPVAWVQRDPQGWSDVEYIPQTKPVIKLGVNLAISCGAKPSQFYPRGACLVALCDILSAQGYSVEVSAFMATRDLDWESSVHVMETTVKAPDAPLDVDGLSLVCSEIGYFRTIGFLTYIEASEKEVSHDLGMPEKMPEHLAEGFDLILDSNLLSMNKALAQVIDFMGTLEANKGQISFD